MDCKLADSCFVSDQAVSRCYSICLPGRCGRVGNTCGIETRRSVSNLHAGANSRGRCAEYTRNAIEAGGVVLGRHSAAKDYGSSLRTIGFLSFGQMSVSYLAGDVAIVDAIEGHPDGHMAMFNGSDWISDFRQQHGLYPGPTYRSKRPRYTIYRYGIRWDSAKPPSSANLT